MTRPVTCLLVGTGGAAADDGIAQMATLVKERFGLSPVTLSGAEACQSRVLAALDEASRGCRQGGLLVMLFSGHGGFNGHQHWWRLSGSKLTDDELTDAIERFDRDTELFIISDCCYGAGILEIGPAEAQGEKSLDPSIARNLEAEQEARHLEMLPALHARLRSFASNAAARLRREGDAIDKARGCPPRGNVVLAAATDWLMVRRNGKNAFVRALCAAIPLASSYAELLPLMTQRGACGGQANWKIVAEPPAVLARPPLAR